MTLRPSKWVVAVVAVCALVAGLWLSQGRGEDGDPAQPSAATSSGDSAHGRPEGSGATLRSGGGEAGETRRDASEQVHSESESAADHGVTSAASEIDVVRGRLVRVDGRPISGVAIVVAGLTAETALLSGSDGSFELSVSRFPARIEIDSSDLVLVRYGYVRRIDADREVILVASSPVELSGVVVNEFDDPVVGAAVRLSVPFSGLSGVSSSLDTSNGLEFVTRSDRDGWFYFERAPAGVGVVRLVATRYGYEEGVLEISTVDYESRRDLRLELIPRGGPGIAVWGRVLNAERDPVDGAQVWCGEQSTFSDALGGFALDLVGVPDDVLLVATAEGHQAAVRIGFGDELANAQERGQAKLGPIDLVLGGVELRIRGRVVDADGVPWAGWDVCLLDGTEISGREYPPLLTERLGGQYSFTHETDEEGYFEIRGLNERSYRIEARDPWTLLSIYSPAIQAGTCDLVMRTQADSSQAALPGQVVTLSGRPIEGVEVTVKTFLGLKPDGGGLSIRGQGLVTDAGGRFELIDVPRERVYLEVSGDSIVTRRVFDLPGESDEPLTIAVEARCRFQYEFSGDGPIPDFVIALDANGDYLPLTLVGSSGSIEGGKADVVEGRTAVTAVSETASLLLLFKDGLEVGRIHLDLPPGGNSVTIVR